MITSRGCPYQCQFCDVHELFGRKTRYRTVDNVIEEMRMLSIEYRVKEIIFYDDTITIDRERVMELCERMIKEKLDISWGCYSRVDRIDDEMSKIMKRAGCHMISMGVESGSDEMLTKMQKGITIEQTRNAFKILKKNNIETSASFIVGFPGETRQTLQKTKEFVKEIDPTFALFFRLIPYPGTSLYSRYLKEENLTGLNIQQFKELGSKRVVPIDNISEEELQRIIRNLLFTFYFRLGKLFQHLLRISSFFRIKGYLRGLMWLIFQKRRI